MKTDIDNKIDNLHKKTSLWMQEGMTEEDIVELLKGEGIDEGYAWQILSNLETAKIKRINFWRLLFLGIVTLTTGLMVNYMSWQRSVESDSMVFWLFWGIVVSGILMIVRAYILYRK